MELVTILCYMAAFTCALNVLLITCMIITWKAAHRDFDKEFRNAEERIDGANKQMKHKKWRLLP
ncbi:hypothetical protein AB4Z21_27805 [Paenibacillus sp. MCAF20]